VALYGSKPRGDDRPDSDNHLLILTTKPLTDAEGFAVVDLLQPVQHRHHWGKKRQPPSLGKLASSPDPVATTS
jgi:hypothetical protein